MRPKRIISGGQTGADRAGLDAAIELGIPTGGYVPKGRRSEDGGVPLKYPLIELDSYDYLIRTERNVVESDATLIFTVLGLTGGSLRTQQFAAKHKRPCKRINLDRLGDNVAAAEIREWLSDNQIETLNIAGSRESKLPGVVWSRVKAILLKALKEDEQPTTENKTNQV